MATILFTVGALSLSTVFGAIPWSGPGLIGQALMLL
jgi:hypothetical protein